MFFYLKSMTYLRFKIGDNESDIIVNHFTSTKFTDLNFIHKSLELRNFTVQLVLNEYTTYNIVNVKSLVYSLKNETTVSKEQQPLPLRQGKIKDNQDKIPFVVSDAVIDDVENSKVYE